MARPRLCETVEEMEAAVEAYFAHCDEGVLVDMVRKQGVVQVRRAKPYTAPGLALALGFNSRTDMFSATHDPRFSNTLTAALARVESQRVEKTLLGEQESRFAQFDLKNNHGYRDEQHLQVTDNTKQMTDDELHARLALLSERVQQIEDKTQRQDVIEGNFQVKLLG
jgi:hypothetical protein